MTESTVSRNVRFLLWREGLLPGRWNQALRERLGWGAIEVDDLLKGGAVGFSQLEQLADVFDRTEEDISVEDLVIAEGTDVLHENLITLMRGLAHGRKKELAERLGVGPNTVSRWLGGKHHPPADKLGSIADFFGLSADLDLASATLFLSLEPVSGMQRREWLHQRVDALSVRELGELYPALKRLLS